MPALIGALLTTLAPVLGDLARRLLPADPDAAAKLQAELTAAVLANGAALERAAAEVVLAEARGESWMQRNWRPCLMFLIMGLLLWNGVAVPLIETFADRRLPTLEAWAAIPEPLWQLLMLGLGGYVVGRSAEKTVKAWREGG